MTHLRPSPHHLPNVSGHDGWLLVRECMGKTLRHMEGFHCSGDADQWTLRMTVLSAQMRYVHATCEGHEEGRGE